MKLSNLLPKKLKENTTIQEVVKSVKGGYAVFVKKSGKPSRKET